MKFEEVLPYLRDYKKIRRKFWGEMEYIVRNSCDGCLFEILDEKGNVVFLQDLIEKWMFSYEDWEVINNND